MKTTYINTRNTLTPAIEELYFYFIMYLLEADGIEEAIYHDTHLEVLWFGGHRSTFSREEVELKWATFVDERSDMCGEDSAYNESVSITAPF